MKKIDWRERLDREPSGNIISNIPNGVLYLTNHEDVKGILAYNEHAEQVYVVKAPPWDKGLKKPRPIKDYDCSCIKYFFDHEKMNVRSSIHDIISIAAGKKKYHPIKDMLRSFEYKGDGYIRKLLPEYLGVEDNEYNYEVMKLAMVAGVKRIYEPGCKYDYCVVFQGRQGIGKSTFISKLALNPEWYSDSISVLGKGREAAEQLRRKWIVEIGELSAFKKSENESIKSFLSSQQDSFREAYKHYASDFPRTCIFFGTTNDKVYLHDNTGNRRILPVLTGITEPVKSLFDELQVKEDFSNAWAEALNIYISEALCGEVNLVLPDSVMDTAVTLQEAANEDDAWTDIIFEYLVEKIEHETKRATKPEDVVECKVNATEIFDNVLHGQRANFQKNMAQRINDVIRLFPEWVEKGTVTIKDKKGRGFKFRMSKSDAEDYLRRLEEM